MEIQGSESELIWSGMPTVADGKIYVTTGQFVAYNGPAVVSQFACLNAYTGQIIWTLPIEALVPRESAIVASVAFGYVTSKRSKKRI